MIHSIDYDYLLIQAYFKVDLTQDKFITIDNLELIILHPQKNGTSPAYILPYNRGAILFNL